MDHEGATSPKTGLLARVPLLVAYLATPAAVVAARVSGSVGDISLDAPWLLLAGVGGLLFMLRRPASRSRTLGSMLLFLILAVAGASVMPDVLVLFSPWLSHLFELHPLAYVLFCLMWAYSFGPPSREDIQRYGGMLGLLVLVDVGVGSFLFHGWPMLRWLGDQEIIATLLLVALCAGLRPGLVGTRRLEFSDGLAWARVLILLGIVGCMSRTAFFVTGWVYLCFGRGSLLKRLPAVLVCVAVVAATVTLRMAFQEQGGQMVDLWTWSQAGTMLVDNPWRLISGYPLDMALILEVPPHVEHLWGALYGQSATTGLYVHMIHPFWLRLTLGWGLGPALAILGVLIVLLLRRPTIFGVALIAVFMGQGLAAPLLYDPASAVALCLGVFPAFRLARGPVAVRRTPKEQNFVPQSPEPEGHDFEIRPL